MYFKACNIIQYKNVKQAQLLFSSGFSWLLGANGMGKTNILDALHVLCLTKSHTNRTDAECVLKGADYYTLTGQIEHESDTHKVYAAYDLRKLEKAIIYDEAPTLRMSEHIGRIPLMSIFPDDIELINESSDHRRKLIDSCLSQQDAQYLADIMIFNKMLAQRNATLKQMNETHKVNKGLVEAIDIPMSELATRIYNKRQSFFKYFAKDVSMIYSRISQSNEDLAIQYDSSLHNHNALDLLQNNFNMDLAYGLTRQGIHKDDIRMQINKLDVRKHGSQGQKKSLLCALKLAQAASLKSSNHQPIIILDDIFDKLDNRRVKNILNYVDDTGSQVLISHTDEKEAYTMSKSLKRPSAFFSIENGNATAL